MTFVGDKGGGRAPDVNRAKLLDPDDYAAAAKARNAAKFSPGHEEPDAERGRRHTSAGKRRAYNYGGQVDEPERTPPPKGIPFATKPTPEGRQMTTGRQSRSDPEGKRAGWSGNAQMDLSHVNSYGFASRSQFFFPEAYKPVDTKFWQPMTAEATADIHARQAAANLKASFTSDKMMPVAQTEADSEYMDATSKRNLSMRRRRKPMNYDERQKDAEIERKLPLTRKYVTGESAFRESSSIVKTGPLDTPILVTGLTGKAQAKPGGAAPEKLKRRRRTRREQMLHDQYEEQQANAAQASKDVALPSFDPKGAPRVRLSGRGHNSFGLKSRSEMMYPEAYREVSSIYWRKLSTEDRQKVMTVQARAMEKVGYERGTEKHFIEEIEPDAGWVVTNKGRKDDTERTGSGISGEAVMGILAVLVVLALIAYGVWQNYGDLVP